MNIATVIQIALGLKVLQSCYSILHSGKYKISLIYIDNFTYYRLQEWQDSKTDSELESKYEELEGGLRVPAKLWQSLYHYQKVGVQWLWELRQQDVGGILGKDVFWQLRNELKI